jgi:hypothetical protein
MHIYRHTSIYTHTNTSKRKECTRTNPYPRTPLESKLVLPPPPRKPLAYQLAIPTPTRTALIKKLTYSHECYPLLTEVPPLSLFSRTLSLTNVSPSHPQSPHQQASLLPRVLSPPNRSTAPLSSLSHSFTNQLFSLAPTLSRLSTAFSLALGPGIGPRRSAGARRPMAATPTDTIGETPLPSSPAPANSRPSSENFPSRRRRRLSGNRLLLAI